MHIPDGFLSAPVWAALDIAAVPALGGVVRRAERGFDEARVPLLGVMGAFVFAAQMINFPVGIGTTGHLVGGALLAVTLGPAAASVVMCAILAIQALVFQDGGVLALGANAINMAFAGVLAGYLPYHLWGAGKGRRAAIFAGGFLSVLVSALLALAELLASGVRMPAPVLGLSVGLFLVSGVLEGAITLAVVEASRRSSRALSGSRGRDARSPRGSSPWRRCCWPRAAFCSRPRRPTASRNSASKRASRHTPAPWSRLRFPGTRRRFSARAGRARPAPGWPAWR